MYTVYDLRGACTVQVSCTYRLGYSLCASYWYWYRTGIQTRMIHGRWRVINHLEVNGRSPGSIMTQRASDIPIPLWLEVARRRITFLRHELRLPPISLSGGKYLPKVTRHSENETGTRYRTTMTKEKTNAPRRFP